MSFTVSETRDLLTVHATEVEIGFSREDAGLRLLRRNDGPNLAGHGDGVPSLDVALGGRGWLAERTLVRYLGHTADQRNDAVEVALVVGIGPLKVYDRYRITGTLVARRLTIQNVGEDEEQLRALRLHVPWLRTGALGSSFFAAPGTTVRPHVPLTVAAALRRDVPPRQFFSPGLRDGIAMDAAPTVAPGLMALADDHTSETLLCWYDGLADPALPQVQGNGLAVTLSHEVTLADWLRPEVALSSEAQYLLLLREPWRDAIVAVRRTWALTMSARPTTPAPPTWLRDAVFYECHPAQLGGFAGLADALPVIAALGVTTLCLLPIWDYGAPAGWLWDGNRSVGNPFAPHDLQRLDPALGPPEALQALVDAAHAVGLRVLLDLPLAGCAPDGPLVPAQPAWFCRDEQGALVTSPADGGVAPFDWASPTLHDFFVNWALALLRDYGLDGLRAVPPRDTPPSWARSSPGHAGASSLGYLRLLDRLRTARPDVALIGTLGGPALAARQDASLDELPHLMFVHMALGRVRADELGAWLTDHWGVLAPDALRICFTEAHHTSDLNPIADGLRGSRLSRMIFAGIVLSGFAPLIWCGQERGEEFFLRAVLAARATSAALRLGSIRYNAALCDSSQVFTVLREHAGEQALGLLHIGPHRSTVTLTLPLDAPGPPDAEYTIFDLLTSANWREDGRDSWHPHELQAIRLTLEPFGAYCLVMRPAPVLAPSAAEGIGVKG